MPDVTIKYFTTVLFLCQQTKGSTTSYFIDWHNPSICIQNSDGTISSKKSDFAIQLEALVEAGDHTGYLADVQRCIDNKRKCAIPSFLAIIAIIICLFYRVCFFTIDSTSFRNKFMAQLNSSFGSGGMTLSLSEPQFCSFIQFLKDEGNARGLPIKNAACHIGLQPSGDIWVLGEDVQVCDNNYYAFV